MFVSHLQHTARLRGRAQLGKDRRVEKTWGFYFDRAQSLWLGAQPLSLCPITPHLPFLYSSFLSLQPHLESGSLVLTCTWTFCLPVAPCPLPTSPLVRRQPRESSEGGQRPEQSQGWCPVTWCHLPAFPGFATWVRVLLGGRDYFLFYSEAGERLPRVAQSLGRPW